MTDFLIILGFAAFMYLCCSMSAKTFNAFKWDNHVLDMRVSVFCSCVLLFSFFYFCIKTGGGKAKSECTQCDVNHQ